jgi:RNA polymerase sigma factor (sigma-70 family)
MREAQRGAKAWVPAQGGFPLTRQSVVLATRSSEPDERRWGYETLLAAYWKPVYKYLRVRWNASTEDAEDLTQGFFARVFEKGLLERYDLSRARFRTYLRTCLDSYVANERKAARRVKRGGDVQLVPLDFENAEGEFGRLGAAGATDPEVYFRQEWVRALFGIAVSELRTRCAAAGKQVHFALFERYDVEGPGVDEKLTYATLAGEFGLPATQVVNYLAYARRQFRGIVLDKLRETCGTEREFRSEARELFGVDPR